MDFFCTKIPVISLVGAAICWVVYLGYPRNGLDINALPHSYWNAMGVITWLIMIFGALFVISLTAYLIRRPLPGKVKWLFIILRILIAASVVVLTCFGVYLSIFIFAAAGY